jgi:hypothetical protein
MLRPYCASSAKLDFSRMLLLKVVWTVPSNLCFYCDIRGVERIAVGNNDSSGHAVEESGRVSAMKAGLPEGDSTAIGSVVCVSRCVGCGGDSHGFPRRQKPIGPSAKTSVAKVMGAIVPSSDSYSDRVPITRPLRLISVWPRADGGRSL